MCRDIQKKWDSNYAADHKMILAILFDMYKENTQSKKKTDSVFWKQKKELGNTIVIKLNWIIISM